ncbi:chromosome partitioning protein [Streptomyces zhaozhouensis]|uniref:Chromosome partitioning protein n=1 Tax=Streptomyces zhaozhouensis TaxID=1300267 RepID=A0A286E861_9ACTN|nr:ParA family protein [Streptomyces zhaozhouensis]SOD67105.1 chromosome partitioning protein [Streptomyces zhaozhouensis]
MSAPYDPDDREKVVAKLPAALRQELKIRAAELNVDIQDAVTEGVHAWRQAPPQSQVETGGGTSFATYLPTGLYGDLKKDCRARSIPANQGMAQAIRLWLDSHPSPRRVPRASGPRRLVFGNQKGGVGKTSTAAGVAEALAEAGNRVCLIDFDPQGHLTQQLGYQLLDIEAPSLAKHMLGETSGELRDLLVPIEESGFGGLLFLLPACKDAFLLDAKLATSRHVRIKETALEKALESIEERFDFVIVDCPPSLGYTMDTALYYGRTREGEDAGTSGMLIPVLAEDSSADAYDMLSDQIQDLCDDMEIEVAQLGFIVNLYDSRRGFIATSSLNAWKEIGDPPVVGIVPDLKEQREAVRLKQALLTYSPECEQSEAMRNVARRVLA